MGGGPRTFPGGLSKWQHKRMHEKLARHKERGLLRHEKQLYLARLRSEIRASHLPGAAAPAVPDRPTSSRAHIRALADRFLRPGAEDLWNEDDGPLRRARPPLPQQQQPARSLPSGARLVDWEQAGSGEKPPRRGGGDWKHWEELNSEEPRAGRGTGAGINEPRLPAVNPKRGFSQRREYGTVAPLWWQWSSCSGMTSQRKDASFGFFSPRRCYSGTPLCPPRQGSSCALMPLGARQLAKVANGRKGAPLALFNQERLYAVAARRFGQKWGRDSSDEDQEGVPAQRSSTKEDKCFSTLSASAHPDYSSSGDERPSCALSEIVQKTSRAPRQFVQTRSCALSSAGVVKNLQGLKKRPDVAFAYFKDTESVGFSQDLSTYAEIIHILSSSGQSRMLFSLFREIVSPATNGGSPEILPLMDHLKRTCTASDSLVSATNCLVTAYITCHDAHDTIGLFGELCRVGVVPAAWACSVLLKFAAESGGGSEIVLSAYAQMKLLGLTLDAHALGIITGSLFQEKKADKAFEVWVEMIGLGAKPDMKGYSSFLTGLCDCGKIDLAYAILPEIIREGAQVDAMAYNKVMDGLCKEMRLEEAEKLLETKIRLGFAPDMYGYSYLIRSYCKEGNILKVLDHFQAMVSHGLETNCHIVSYLLQCFMKVGMASHVTEHFHKFRDSGVRTDGVLYNIAMDAYCKLGNMDEAVKLLAEMETDGLAPDRIHYTCLIKGYCSKGDIPNAQQVFEEMLKANVKPDVVTYNILASGFCRNGLVTEVFDLLDHMQDQGLEPNSLTYGIAIDGFCRRGNLSEAEVLFNIVEERGIDHIEVLYSSMVCGYLSSGWTDHAYVLFLRVAKQGKLVDRFSRSKLINDLCRDGNVKGASNVCSTMLEKNVVPDLISYSKLIAAYCQTGDMHKARLWFHDMIQRGLSADVIVYTVLMNGYCKVGRMQEACTLFVQMTSLGIKPDVVAYTVLLDGHLKEDLQKCWQGISKERRSFLLRAKQNRLLSSMREMEIEPDVPCYTVLIDGQCKADYLEEARGLFDEMLQKGLAPDLYAYTALINGYCSQGETAKAEGLFQEMVDRGIKPDVLTFSVLNQKVLRHRRDQPYV